MSSIKKLEQLDLKEVSKRTHIEEKFLHFMITKQFDKLNKVITLGFVKILKREYGLNLNDWVKEFQAFNDEHEDEQTKTEKKPVFTKEVKPSKPINKIWIFLLSFIILICFAFWKLDGISLINNFRYNLNSNTQKNVILDSNASKNSEILEDKNTQTDEEDIKNIDEDINNKDTINQENQNIDIVDLNSSENKNEEATLDTENLEQTNSMDENNTAKIEENNQSKEESSIENIENEKKDLAPALTQVKIVPNRKIWLGVIDLKTHKKIQKLTQDDILINLDKNQLIVTGHGEFSFENEKGEVENLNTKNKQYYMIENGKVMKLDRRKFMSLNGGKIW